MAKRLSLTRPELKRQRDRVARFSRYLPMLKLKQQLLQVALHETSLKAEEADKRRKEKQQVLKPYINVLSEPAGVNMQEMIKPSEVLVKEENIAGLEVLLFQGVEFSKPAYSLFATPPWLDQAVEDLRSLAALEAELKVQRARQLTLQGELTRTLQRVNLFEKVKIPECQEAIRKIRIHLGDEMAASVGRAKIAKSKLEAAEAE